MKRFLVKGITVAMLGAVLAFLLAAPAFAQTTIQNPTTGQPGVECGVGTATSIPGGSGSTTTESPFNEAGTAGTVYAGSDGTASQANANSTAAVSQYDVACQKVSQQP
jgi:hypothetical protein